MGAHLEPWERAWLDHRARWELELIGQPGVYSDLCAMDVLDWQGPDVFLEWYREETG